MSFRPIALHAVACDGCGRTVHLYDYDSDADYELRLDTPEINTSLRREITDQGWLLIDRRTLCPADAQAATDATIERLEIELTHDPLYNLNTETGDAT